MPEPTVYMAIHDKDGRQIDAIDVPGSVVPRIGEGLCWSKSQRFFVRNVVWRYEARVLATGPVRVDVYVGDRG